MDCVKILQSYGLRRPSSSMSLASHVSINAAIDPPTLDQHGHVVLKTVGRHFSFSRRGSTASLSSQFVDGQAPREERGDGLVTAQAGSEGDETDQGVLAREQQELADRVGEHQTIVEAPVGTSATQTVEDNSQVCLVEALTIPRLPR